MKFFIVLFTISLTVYVQALTPEQEAKVKEYFKDCLASTGANADAVQKSRQGQFVDDPKIGEFVFCFFKKAGIMNDTGVLQADVVKAKISGDIGAAEAGKVIEKCNSVTGKDNNEKAYNLYKCYWNATPTHVTLIH